MERSEGVTHVLDVDMNILVRSHSIDSVMLTVLVQKYFGKLDHEKSSSTPCRCQAAIRVESELCIGAEVWPRSLNSFNDSQFFAALDFRFPLKFCRSVHGIGQNARLAGRIAFVSLANRSGLQ
jgi:hypothetical protein